VAAESLDGLPGNGHPQTDPSGIAVARPFQAKERLEHRFALIGGDSRAVVDHPDYQRTAAVGQFHPGGAGIAQGVIDQIVQA